MKGNFPLYTAARITSDLSLRISFWIYQDGRVEFVCSSACHHQELEGFLLQILDNKLRKQGSGMNINKLLESKVKKNEESGYKE